MTKEMLMNYAVRMDRDKLDLYHQGMPFMFVSMEDGDLDKLHTVIVGNGEECSAMIMRVLVALYESAAKQGTTPEAYADSVAKGLVYALSGEVQEGEE